VPEQTLQQGEIVTIQFDRPTAFLGLELNQESPPEDGIPGLALVAPQGDLDDDFSAAAYIIEFLVASASGITATAVCNLVSKVLSERGKTRGITIVVEQLPSAPEDDRLRLRVTSQNEPPEQR